MIVDAHAHLSDMPVMGVYTSLETLLSLMDSLGIDLAISMDTGGVWECFEEAYRASLEAHERSRGRLPFALVFHPLYIEDSLDWIRRALGHSGMVGIKIAPGPHPVYPEDPRYEPAWQLAAEEGLPIITHSWALVDYHPSQRFAAPEHFEYYATRFPQVDLMLGHAGGRYEGQLAAVRLAQACPNVYLDISGDVYPLGFIEWLVKQVGATRVLFGSDAEMVDPRTQLGRVLDADITLEEKRLILGENACRLFRLREAK